MRIHAVQRKEEHSRPSRRTLAWSVRICQFFWLSAHDSILHRGDTGKVAELLGIDSLIRVIIAIAGFAALLWVIRKTARSFSDFIPGNLDMNMRSRYVYRIMFFPIMIGSVVNTLLAFPVAAFLSVIYPATSSYVIMSSFSVILERSNPEATRSECEKRIVPSLAILALCTIVLNRLLTLGVG